MIWGSKQNISNALKLMTTIGLIRIFNDKSKFGEGETYSKTYLYYVENEKLFKKYCKDNKIDAYTITIDSNNG